MMFSRGVLLSFVLMTAYSSAVAQAPVVPDFSPVEIMDGKITFRMFAPNAKSVDLVNEVVTVSGRDSVPMTKDEKGIWSASVSGMVPELYSYSFVVDGAPVVDQKNPGAKVGPRGLSTRFEMPGSPEFYAAQKTPHGKVEINWHHSALLNQVRPLWVYTPPGYTANQSTRYPVMYLLHGSGDLEGGWVEDGKMNFILDNLIAAGKAKPMVVVMPRGHVLADRQIDREQNNKQLQQVLVQELIPFVEANYRVLTDQPNRAIVGLSMGGGQTLRFGLQNLDKFAWVVGLSPAVLSNGSDVSLFDGLIADPKKSNAALKLLMIRCGTMDHLITNSDKFTAFLKSHDIKHTYVRTDYESRWPGRKDDHTWPIWRMDLRDVAPLLFR